MSKDLKKTKKMTVENVENLKTACKIINETISSFHYWKVDEIWPVNLYIQGLKRVVEILNNVIFKEETEDFVSRSHINDK